MRARSSPVVRARREPREIRAGAVARRSSHLSRPPVRGALEQLLARRSNGVDGERRYDGHPGIHSAVRLGWRFWAVLRRRVGEDLALVRCAPPRRGGNPRVGRDDRRRLRHCRRSRSRSAREPLFDARTPRTRALRRKRQQPECALHGPLCLRDKSGSPAVTSSPSTRTRRRCARRVEAGRDGAVHVQASGALLIAVGEPPCRTGRRCALTRAPLRGRARAPSPSTRCRRVSLRDGRAGCFAECPSTDPARRKARLRRRGPPVAPVAASSRGAPRAATPEHSSRPCPRRAAERCRPSSPGTRRPRRAKERPPPLRRYTPVCCCSSLHLDGGRVPQVRVLEVDDALEVRRIDLFREQVQPSTGIARGRGPWLVAASGCRPQVGAEHLEASDTPSPVRSAVVIVRENDVRPDLVRR